VGGLKDDVNGGGSNYFSPPKRILGKGTHLGAYLMEEGKRKKRISGKGTFHSRERKKVLFFVEKSGNRGRKKASQREERERLLKASGVRAQGSPPLRRKIPLNKNRSSRRGGS